MREETSLPSHLSRLLWARSVAVVGASTSPVRIGGRPIAATIHAGYRGALYPVNPQYEEVAGLRCYPTLRDLPEVPEVIISAVSRERTLEVISQAGELGSLGVVVFASGYRETGEEGAREEERLAAAAKAAGVIILGPNCLGMINTESGLMASFTATLESGPITPGAVGFVCQSGAFGSYFLALARRQSLGVRYWIATGNETQVSVADWIQALALDDSVSVIAGYLEGINAPERLVEALAVARDHRKPVILLKAGRSAAGASAALSHTGSMVGDDGIFDALCRGFGVFRVRDLEELIDLSQAASFGRMPRTTSTALLTVSGGVGIMMADRADEVGLELPSVSDSLASTLRSLVPYAGLTNPIDFTGQFLNDASIAGAFFREVALSHEFDAAVVFLGHTILAESLARPAIEAICGAVAETGLPTVVSGLASSELVATLHSAGIAIIVNPLRAVDLIANLNRLRSPSRGIASRASGVPVFRETSGVLGEASALAGLAWAGVRVARFGRALTPQAAHKLGHFLASELVIKADRPDLTHKSSVGGVMVGVTPESIEAAIGVLRLRLNDPDLGVIVAEQIHGELELIVGMTRHPGFGAVILVALGGTLAEMFDVKVEMLASEYNPEDLVAALGGVGLGRAILAGGRFYSDGALADLLDIVGSVVEAASAYPELIEFEINPVIWSVADGHATAVDALGVFSD
ncbi:MAG: acetate--CoA ligase family protein [Ferrimicrobium sp.]